MARIPDSEIERLKSEVSLVRLVEAAGVELKRQGKDLVGRCPFHSPDNTPSLLVSEAKNLWHCMGACQTGGTVVDWVMKTQGVSFRHAVELLRNDSPLAAAAPVKQTTVRRLPAPVSVDADDRALLRQVIGYYHDTLKQSPEAMAYLKARGIDHPEAVERFRLGFANRTLGLRLPESTRKAGAELRGGLQRIGILRESGHEHFNGSLVIPVIDEAGDVAEVYGRKLRDDLRPGTPKHLYLPGAHRGVWNWQALAEHREIILCEALIDALTFWCAGYRNVTAAYGVEGFTGDHLAAFKQHGTRRVLIAYDRDDAGDKAAGKLAERLMAEGLDCYRIQFPKGMDTNEYALKLQPAHKSLGLVIRKALWLGQGAAPSREPPAVIEEAPIAAPAPKPLPLAAELPAPPPEPLPASPLPPTPPPAIQPEVSDTETVLRFGDRRWRVRGLAKNLSPDVLKINLLVSREAAPGSESRASFYVDTLDLYLTRARTSYATQAAVELQVPEGVVKDDLGRVLLALEALQDQHIRKTLEPAAPAAVQMSEPERAAALALLKSPDLLERIAADLTACGLVGESTNKLAAYLAATSRLLDRPLAVMVRASSAAGKSSLMDAVLALMPDEQAVKYSAMTGQALYYLPQGDLKHKILAIAEEEGAHRAAYALKLLQSEGELTMVSTGKDPETGMLVAHPYRVEGPVMLFTTTTAAELDDELLNRCLVLTVDESRVQTQAIHQAQRAKRTLEGIAARAGRDQLRSIHRNAQRLLRPLAVLNPYADSLSFPHEATRTRRAHEHYLTLIDTIALLHQHQRPIKSVSQGGQAIEYVEVTAQDIAQANALAHEALGRSLDELPPQTRSLLRRVCAWVGEQAQARAMRPGDFRFSRRQVREALGLGDTQAKVHLARLVELEYLIAHRRATGTDYELAYDGGGDDGRPFVPGLIDAAALSYDAGRSGQTPDRAGPGRAAVGARSAGGRGAENSANADRTVLAGDTPLPTPKRHVNGKAAPQAVVA